MKRISIITIVVGLLGFPAWSNADLSIQSARHGSLGNIASSWLTFGLDDGGVWSGATASWRLEGSIEVALERAAPVSLTLADGSASVAVFSGATQVGTLTLSAFDMVGGLDTSAPIGVISMTVAGLGLDPIFDSFAASNPQATIDFRNLDFGMSGPFNSFGFGIHSAVPVNELGFFLFGNESSALGQGGSGSPGWGIDLASMGSSFHAIPAPGAIVLGAFGLAMVAFCRRRASRPINR